MSDKIALHPSGAVIEFNEADHIYTVDGVMYTSATTVLSEYMNKFNADLIAYYVARRDGRSKQDVLDEWEVKKVEACDFGNAVHLYAERRCMGLSLPEPTIEREEIAFALVGAFIDDLLEEYEVMEAEKIVFSIPEQISGTVDLLARHKRTGLLHLFDWKTSKKIEAKNKHSKPCHAPIGHLLDSNYTKYSLQLSLYKRLLEVEGYVKEPINKLSIVHITPEGCENICAGDKSYDIDTIFEHRRNLKAQMEEDHGI